MHFPQLPQLVAKRSKQELLLHVRFGLIVEKNCITSLVLNRTVQEISDINLTEHPSRKLLDRAVFPFFVLKLD